MDRRKFILGSTSALTGGLLVYALTALWLHAPLFGVRPFG